MNWLRKLLTGILNSILVFTLTMLPNALNMQGANVGIVYANEPFSEDEPCVNTDGTQVEGYYQKGCAFKENQIDMQEWKGSWGAAEIINYLMILTTSLVMVSSIGFTPYNGNLNDCPMNQAGPYTIPIVMVAAGAHLVEEILMNFLYKDAAEQAANTYIEGSKTTENQDAQLEAFDKLIELYGTMQTLQTTRIVLHSILAAVYAGVTTAETVNMTTCSSQCTTTRTSASSGVEATLTSLQTLQSSLTGSIQTCATTGGSPTGVASCQALVTEVGTDYADLRTQWTETQTQSASRETQEAQQAAEESTEQPSRMAEFLVPITNMTPAAKEALSREVQLSEETDISNEQAQEAQTTASRLNRKARRLRMPTTITTALTTCQSGTLAGCASLAQGSAACTSQSNACFGQLRGQVNTFVQNINTFGQYMEQPVQCCNAFPSDVPSILESNPPTISQISTLRDIDFPAAESSAFFHRDNYIEKDKIELERKLPNIIKAIAYNAMMNYYINKEMKHYPNDPKKNLAEYAKYHERTERLLETNPAHLLQKPLRPQEIELALINNMNMPKSVETTQFSNLMSKVSEAIFMPNAYAFIDFSNAGTKLGISVMVLLIAYLLRDFFQQWFLTHPLNRTLTYGFMTLLAGGQIVIDGVTLAKINDNLDAVRNERERFVAASAVNTELTGGEGEGGGAVEANVTTVQPVFFNNQEGINCDAKASQTSQTAREVRKGEAFSTACSIRNALPSINPESPPRNSAIASSGLNMGPVGGLMPAINSMAGGMSPSHSAIQGGELLASAQNARNLMKDLQKKSMDKYDSIFGKDKKGKSKKGYVPLATAIQKAFTAGKSGNVNSIAATASIPGSTGASEAAGKGGSGLPQKFKTQDFAAVAPPPGADPGFDFSLGDTKEELGIPKHGLRDEKAPDISNLDIEYNDIANKPGASIFKLLSNRYILQYPKLLEEVRPRLKELPVAKNEKAKPATEKDKLKEALNESGQ